MGAHDGFDRVGDEVSRLQREGHTFGTHRDTVGDTDSIESHTDHTGLRDTMFDFLREVEQVHVTGVAFIPDAGDTDLRLVHVLFGHARCVEHRLRGALAAGLGNTSTVFIERICHGVYFCWPLSLLK